MDDDTQRTERRHQRRLGLIWEVVIFQFKLAADGVRDLLLSPISIGAALLGLIRGGDEPDQYFRRLQRFGRRSDLFINLFGHHSRGPTADRLAEPLQQTLEDEFNRGGWLRRRVDRLNVLLDDANARTRRMAAGEDAAARTSSGAPATGSDQDAVDESSSSSEVR